MLVRLCVCMCVQERGRKKEEFIWLVSKNIILKVE